MTGTSTAIRKTWVAFGPNGAMASIHATDEGYAVRFLDRDAPHGTYETLEIAKRAITSQRGVDVTFEQH